MARMGNACSSSTCRMTSPTAPVAPTTATLGNTKVPFHERGNASTPSAIIEASCSDAMATFRTRRRTFACPATPHQLTSWLGIDLARPAAGLARFMYVRHWAVSAKPKRGSAKGVGNLLPERPEGCFAQKVPDPFCGAGTGPPPAPPALLLRRSVDEVPNYHRRENRPGRGRFG